ncbi:DUF5753 domain-containing protein [Actinomadura sp. 1N219]|uniref:DUF5753 domain-containing protein n=1 Tax=Actinomadura sp. 1N219 TaxID=3375152 RepID=UPI0037BA5C9A
MHISGSLVSGIELCARRPTFKVCQKFDEVFGLEQFFEALYPRVIEETGLPAGFPEFVDAESDAAMIKKYENFAITGLFHTEDYARAVLRAFQQPGKLEQVVAERMQRQEILHRENPPVIVALIDASALRRPFGGREVMRAQLERLLDLAALPQIRIHVVPEDAELLPEGSFTILCSPGEPDTAYAEMAGGRGRLIDDDGYVAELGILFELIRSKALNAEDSQAAIRKALEELWR